MRCLARNEFELVPSKGSEPDLIIIGNNNLIIIEAKLNATNITSPSNLKVEEKYTIGETGWWNEVFTSDFKKVAIDAKKYELSRFWLLGTWMAQQLGVGFHLVNLVPGDRENGIQQSFGMHIKQDECRHFLRTTWEDIFNFFLKKDSYHSREKEQILNYLQNKSIGYGTSGRLQKSFFTGSGITSRNTAL